MGNARFRVRLLTIVLGCIVLVLSLSVGLRAADASERRSANVPREALAFYYGWYGNPQVSQRWYHWKNVDTAKKHIDESTHYPALGAYDSHDPKLIETHLREAKQAGLTGFIVSWWARGDFHDQGMPLILDAAQKQGMKITVYYETVPPRDKPTVEGAVDDLSYIVEKYANHPAWLRVHKKPVIFVYGRAVGQVKVEGWENIITAFNARNPAGAVFIGDQISPKAAGVFDGIHTYNPTGLTKGKSVDEIRSWAKTTFPEWVRIAGPQGIACITIIPGYDDSVQPSRQPPRPITDRHNGETYRVMWQEAIAANPDWIIVTSWNEWHEGSEIEPSVELGDRELKTTLQFARKFISMKPRHE